MRSSVIVGVFFAVFGTGAGAAAGENDIATCRRYFDIEWPEPGSIKDRTELTAKISDINRRIEFAYHCATNQLSDTDRGRYAKEYNERLAKANAGVETLRAELKSLIEAESQTETALQTWVQRLDDLRTGIDSSAEAGTADALAANLEMLAKTGAEIEAQFAANPDYTQNPWSTSVEQALRSARQAGDRARATLEILQRLASIVETAAVRRLGFSAADVHDLAKIEKALLTAGRDDIFFAPEGGQTPEYGPTAAHRDDPISVQQMAEVRGQNDLWQQLIPYRDRPRAEEMSMRTPFIIWAADGNRATVITFDGGVYSTSLMQQGRILIERGIPPAANWAKPLEHDYLSVGDLQILEEAGAIPAGTLATLEAKRDAINRCTIKVWRGADADYDRIEQANLTEKTRANRLDALDDRVYKSAYDTCKSAIRGFEATFTGVASIRSRTRSTIAKKARSHLVALSKQ